MKTKKLLFAVLFIVLVGDSYGQAPSWVWAKGAGGNDIDYSNSVTTDNLGNIIITGSFRGNSIFFGTDTLVNVATNGSFDIFVTKYDVNGNVLWAKSAGGNYDDGANSVTTDNNGNIIVVGYFNSSKLIFGFDTLINSSIDTADIFIVKYDANGNVLWAKSRGKSNTDIAYSVTTDSQDNILVAGSGSIFIEKYDSAGSLLWIQSPGGVGGGIVYAITTDAWGNVIAGGKFSGPYLIFGPTTLNNASDFGYSDIFIVKYDAGGIVQWAKSAGGKYWDETYSVAADSSGNIIMAGGFFSNQIHFDSDTLFSATGSSDIFVVKYDSSGHSNWARSAGGVGDDYANEVTVDQSGNILVAGGYGGSLMTFDSINISGPAGNGFNMFIVKYNSTGTALWAKSNGITAVSAASSLTTDIFNNIIITGTFNYSLIHFDAITLNNLGGDDIYLAKLSSTVSINEISASNNLVVYPNPATNKLTLSFNAPPKIPNLTTLHLCDITGRIILEKTLSGANGENKMEIDVSGVAKGVYFLNIFGSSANAKVMIE